MALTSRVYANTQSSTRCLYVLGLSLRDCWGLQVCDITVADAFLESAEPAYACSAACAQMVLPWAAGCRVADISNAGAT